jgi:dTDP-4-amino-4,6-dideoxygalactose transaminase
MKVNFVDLKAQYLEIKDEIDAALAEVIEHTAFIGGKHARAFEEDFAAYLGARHCIGVGNGTDALYVAMVALDIGPGDEVITAANTFIATSEAITRTGAEVVFVEAEEDHYTLDPARLEAAITPRTKAIVPVHLYGQPADMDPILAIAAAHDLVVIEDAAQAHGALYRDRRIGTLGRCACFSFYPGKNLGAYGDAGGVVTDDDELADRIRMYCDHGSAVKYTHQMEGINSRLDGFQGAVLQVKLRHLEAWTERRIAVARAYDEGLAGVVETPRVRPDVRHVYHLYVVQLDDRDDALEFLKERGIYCGIHYPIALPFQPAYGRLGATPADFPLAHGQMGRILSLPMHGSMTDAEVAHVIEQVREFARR